MVQIQPVGHMAPGDHQAVALAHGIGIGDAERQFVLQQHPAAALQRTEHTTVLALLVTGLQSAEVGGVGVALAGIAAEAEGLQVAEVIGSAVVFRDDVVHLQGPLVLVRPAAFAAPLGAGQHSLLDRAVDRCAVTAPVGEHLLTALLAERVEALTAQVQQLIAFGVAQLLATHEGVGALLAAGDAIAGEHLAHHAFDAFGVVLDLGHVLPQNSPCHVLRGGWAAAAEHLHQHQRLIPMTHAHALGDEPAQAKEGSRVAGGHGAMVAAARPQCQPGLVLAAPSG